MLNLGLSSKVFSENNEVQNFIINAIFLNNCTQVYTYVRSEKNVIFDLGMRHVSNAGWIEFAGSAVETIFTLVKDPLAVMGRLLDECHPETQVENSTNQDANTLWANEVAEEIGNKSDVNEEIVRRFVCLLGHVAQNTAVFLEMNVFNEVQFHKRKREQEKEAKKASRRAAAVSAGGKGTSDGGSNLNTSRMSGMRRGAASATNARQSVTHSVASTTLSNTVSTTLVL